ncbi:MULTISPECIES: DJ-1/PfpI family protein [Enterobacteriaceae]|uniref:DJ-1/PfpI family protein n=1 Tax=Enterobacteriaceae TaxID=543 RepID=UPI000667EE7D|nr:MULTISPECIES: DJ-1/PfpI family protein [Enterobacteriaceae]
MNTAGILIDNGFEDAEAVVVYSLLRDACIDAVLISCSETTAVSAYFGSRIKAHHRLSDVSDQFFDALILCSGKRSEERIAKNPLAISVISQHDRAGKFLCAISSASVRILAANQLLRGRRFTCSAPFWYGITDGIYQPQDLLVDDNLITARGLGVVEPFTRQIIDKLHEKKAFS